MITDKSSWDAFVVVGLIVVFALPFTLLIPNFSVMDVIPKIRVTRYHFFAQYVTWNQLNAGVIFTLVLFFSLYLEIRKRKLDDIVETVMSVSQETDKAMEIERERQAASVRVCVKLLDASSEHYEHLVLFRQELRMRKQQPPAIELSHDSISMSN